MPQSPCPALPPPADSGQNDAMDPVAALEEIAFLLERDRASSFKSKAFRRAADVIRQYSPDELAERVRNGTLKRTKGIGDSTYAVIAESVGGQVPAYLADLRERSGPAVAASVDGLRSKLKGDLHSHTEWSDGTTPIATMARAAQLVGLEYLVISDHSPNLTVANGLSAERLEQQLGVLDELNAVNELGGGGIRLLSGIETDILLDGTLDQTPEMLGRLDVVVASVHSKLRMESREMTARMLRAIETPRMNVLGHCTGRLVEGSRGTRPQSTFDAKAVFGACAEHDVAVEINSRPERQDPPDELIQLALDAGCLFSIDTDAHAPGHFTFLDLGAARAEANGVPAERIVTTWPVERLLEWTSGG
jgi:putative hydrolase